MIHARNMAIGGLAAAFALGACTLAGCSTPTQAPTAPDTEQRQTQPPQAEQGDPASNQTVDTQETTQTAPGEPALSQADVDAGTVTDTVAQEASLVDLFEKADELLMASKATAVLQGTVSSVSYHRIDGITFTRMVVDVAEVLRGTVADQIVVWETGGFAPAWEVAAENADKFPDRPSPTVGRDEYVEYRFLDAEHPSVGQRLVLAVIEVPDIADSTQSAYSILGGPTGRFTVDPESGTLVRAAVGDAGWETQLSPQGFAAVRAELK
ncbi:MAG: hypothetical protein FWD59_04605 [Micrococcales bacterium]|nr:hypothetical protein [Micrococcales bacterium]